MLFLLGLLLGLLIGIIRMARVYDDKIRECKPMVVDDVVYYAEPCIGEEDESDQE